MDRNALHNLAVLYARTIDDRNFDQLGEIMLASVRITSASFQCDGLPAFKEVLQQLHKYVATLHLVGNQLGEWRDGVYHSETACIANHIYIENGLSRKWEVGIRYQDRIVEFNGRPMFSERHLKVLWELDQPLLIPADISPGAP